MPFIFCLPSRLFAAASGDGAGGWLVSGGKGVSNSDYFQTTEIYKPDGTWAAGPDLPTEFHSHCQVQVGTKVFIIGGRSVDNTSPSTFLLENSRWKEMEKMKQPREFHACVEFLGNIYSIGGTAETGPIATVEIYDTNTNTWKDGPELPIPLVYAQAFNYQNTLYILGGSNNKQVFYLQPTSTNWEVLNGVEVVEELRVFFPAAVVSSDVLEVCFE